MFDLFLLHFMLILVNLDNDARILYIGTKIYNEPKLNNERNYFFFSFHIFAYFCWKIWIIEKFYAWTEITAHSNIVINFCQWRVVETSDTTWLHACKTCLKNTLWIWIWYLQIYANEVGSKPLAVCLRFISENHKSTFTFEYVSQMRFFTHFTQPSKGRERETTTFIFGNSALHLIS